MKRLQVNAACLLLTLSFHLVAATNCTTCPEGFFMVKNCTTSAGWNKGVSCKECTNCSATNRQTVSNCIGTFDSVCGENSTVAPVGVGVLKEWMVFSGIVLWLVALMLLTLCLVLLYRRRCQKNFSAGLSPL